MNITFIRKSSTDIWTALTSLELRKDCNQWNDFKQPFQLKGWIYNWLAVYFKYRRRVWECHISAPVDFNCDLLYEILSKREVKALVRWYDTEISIHLFTCRTLPKNWIIYAELKTTAEFWRYLRVPSLIAQTSWEWGNLLIEEYQRSQLFIIFKCYWDNSHVFILRLMKKECRRKNLILY